MAKRGQARTSIPSPGLQPRRSWSPAAFLAVLLAGCQVSPPVIGLRPIDPPVRYGPSGLGGHPQTRFVNINTLQPTLTWEVFPRRADREKDKEGFLNRIAAAGYDLKIWRTENGVPADLVYAREGLPEPTHRLEEPLAAQTRYCWTVRARFEIDGQARVTEWGLSEWPWSAGDAAVYGAWTPRRIGQIPPPNYYRFQTP